MEKTDEIIIRNVLQWIEEHKQFFIPPVCNKLMHTGGQIDVMFVGGPNSRKDYHIEGGEELFVQVKGDMVLKVLERGKHRDIVIKEGEIFLLPRAVPHSPQRLANTVGLVLERRRHDLELDGLRYFTEVDGKLQTSTLYEVWFGWRNQSMPELFEQYFNSEQFKSGKPIPGTIPDNPPIAIDTKIELQDPFNLREWLQNNHELIDQEGKVPVFDLVSHQLQVYVCGRGETTHVSHVADTWIWQMTGDSRINCQDKDYQLHTDDSALIPIGNRFTLHQENGSRTLVCYQDPTKSPSYPG